MTATLVLNWLFNQAQGSVLVLMVCHAVNNAVSGRYFFPMLDGADAARQPWLLTLTWGTAAVALLLVGGSRDLSRRHPRQIEPTTGRTVAAGPGQPAAFAAQRKE
jgi:hypothetical protein